MCNKKRNTNATPALKAAVLAILRATDNATDMQQGELHKRLHRGGRVARLCNSENVQKSGGESGAENAEKVVPQNSENETRERFIQEGIKKGSALLPCKSEKEARALLPEIRAQLPEGRDVTVIHHGKKYLLNIYSWKEVPAPPERRQP